MYYFCERAFRMNMAEACDCQVATFWLKANRWICYRIAWCGGRPGEAHPQHQLLVSNLAPGCPPTMCSLPSLELLHSSVRSQTV